MAKSSCNTQQNTESHVTERVKKSKGDRANKIRNSFVTFCRALQTDTVDIWLQIRVSEKQR